MGYVKSMRKVPKHYQKNIAFFIRDYNKEFPLPYYFKHALYKNGTYKIADIGSGPVCNLGGKMAGKKIEIYASDVCANGYNELVESFNTKLLIPVEYQDMENLTYPDEFFDVVHCVNAIDHTPDARKALSEMERVCKKGGWIYLRHSLEQKKNFGGGHYWNVTVEGISNDTETIILDGYETVQSCGFIISNKYK